ncbi:ArfGap-domain-containing protein [Athelia psychrophila]|uniref:ArfGap-domain-containing protein n=1 Tax=Athelia psychrophila TaxID=1759441 RepID=A0A166BSL6_9AGAM|nr:ArfGap-domain-containing protein [Fibularhizoctonia sp. CBS 109695]
MNKVNADRYQRALLELAHASGNDHCADCKARVPRWASHNLGIFVCVTCASVHRKMGTHISKVKSVTMDTWTKEQVEVMRQNGNVKSNSFYNPNETRNPPPTNMVGRERDSELEKYIRAKYEFKRFVVREAPTKPAPDISRSSTSQFAPEAKPPPPRSFSAAPQPTAAPPRVDSLGYRPPTAAPVSYKPPYKASSATQNRSVSQPLPSQQSHLPPPPGPSQPAAPPQAIPRTAPPTTSPPPSNNPVWNDLLSLQGGQTASSSLPLQYQPLAQNSLPQQQQQQQQPFASPFGQQQIAQSPGSYTPQNGAMGMNMSGHNPFQQQTQQPVSSNPFGQQPSFQTQTPNFTGIGGGQSGFQSSIPPFSQSAAAQQFQASLQQQPQTQFSAPLPFQASLQQQPQSQFSAPLLFQPQPQQSYDQQQQTPFGQQQPSPNPFGQQPSPMPMGQQQPSPMPFGQQPSPMPYGQQPSPMPFGQQNFGQQPSPQPPIQQNLQQQPGMMMPGGNPFGQWQQQPQQNSFQGGFQGQQQW